MSKYYDKAPDISSLRKGRPRKNPWLFALKIGGIVVCSLCMLFAIALWIISYYLSPQRITRLIEEESSSYLNAEIKIGNLDYKIFSSYPWLSFELDSLYVVSKTLDNIPADLKDSLPPDASLLASVEMVKGKINIHSLLHNEVNIRDIDISRPSVNIVILNDSLNNYNIVRDSALSTLPSIKKIPKIDISRLNIEGPVLLDFFSLPDRTQASVDINSFFLTRNPSASDHSKRYDIGFDGTIAGRYQEFSLPSDIPVEFQTGIEPHLPDISLDLYSLNVKLADVALDATGEIHLSPKEIDCRQLNLLFNISDLFELVTLLPDQLRDKVILPDGLSGYLPLSLDIALTEPYSVSLKSSGIPSDLPALHANIKVEDARLHMAPPGLKKISAKDIILDVECNYDPVLLENNSLEIKKLHIEGEGIALSGSASVLAVDSMTQNLKANLFFESDLLETLGYFLPGLSKSIAGHIKGNLNFKGEALNLRPQDLAKVGMENVELKNIGLSGALSSRSLGFSLLPTLSSLSTFNTTFSLELPSYLDSDYKDSRLSLSLNADSIKIKSGQNDLVANRVDLTIAGSFEGTGNSPQSYPTVSQSNGAEDALIASRAAHTPLVLVYGGGPLSLLPSMVKIDAEMKIGGGKFKSPDYVYPVTFNGIDISTNLNRLNIFASDVKTANSGFSIAAQIDGLTPFFTSYSATPLKADAEINFTNVDINALSYGYYGALLKRRLPSDSVFYLPPMLPFTAADSLCVVIPRNLEANIRLRANSAEYMQYKFMPLSTDILLNNGVATLSKLTVGTPYCTAVVDWTYSTRQLNNIFMDLKANVENFSFEPFYKVFPELTAKAPEMKNFTGNINADIGCKFLMFPNMFMNPESLKANFVVDGSHLQFEREGKVEKITHLMLIKGDEPIQLHNLHITGSLHDNLLQINPFKIEFEDYQLEFAGVNNLAGKIYYHLALQKSPFHLPFGVSVLGTLKHPEIKLGGTHIDDYRAEMVSLDNSSTLDANIMAYLRHGWLIFIQEAAKWQAANDKQTTEK
ncbi:MAG: hypothetical protein J1F38_09795 [Muribaculaceae bacterium]|nr:hypothetical protein [Muribaculaceae bacterium]